MAAQKASTKVQWMVALLAVGRVSLRAVKKAVHLVFSTVLLMEHSMAGLWEDEMVQK